MTVAQEMLELAEKINAADFLLIRDCLFDPESVDTYLSGEQQNLIVIALRESAALLNTKITERKI